MKKILLIVLLSTTILWLTSCSDKPVLEETKNDAEIKNYVEVKDNIESKDIVQKVKEFKIDSFVKFIDWKNYPQFSVKEIKVKLGDTVKIKVNTINGIHDFKIDELNVYSETPTWEVTTIEFKADKIWEFVYWCTKPNHRQNGHWGTLIVSE